MKNKLKEKEHELKTDLRGAKNGFELPLRESRAKP